VVVVVVVLVLVHRIEQGEKFIVQKKSLVPFYPTKKFIYSFLA
jgi:hypothetical protein